MVWTKEKVINFLNAKVKDISYFEYPIPVKLLLEEINHNKNTHDILKDVKILIGIIKNEFSDILELTYILNTYNIIIIYTIVSNFLLPLFILLGPGF